MLSNFKNLMKLTGQILKKWEFRNSVEKEKLLTALKCDFCITEQVKNFHTNTLRNRISRDVEYKKAARKDARKEGAVTNVFKGDLAIKREEGFFPRADLSNTLFEGVPFKDLPIVRIKATRNNTLLSLIDNNYVKIVRSCGTEGFKNARKGTNVAAQTAGNALGLRAVRRGYKNVRVLLGGLGPGRLSSIKGLQLGGLKVISITDCTVDYTTLRPRKQRRL